MMRLRISTVLLAILLLAALGTAQAGTLYYDTVMADGPIGYWRLGETGSTTALDSATPTSEDGTAHAGVALGAAASALVSDTDNLSATFSGDNDTGYIDVASSDPFNFDIDDPFTLEAWVKTTSTDFDHIVCKYDLDAVGGSQGYFMGIRGTAYAPWSLPGGSLVLQLQGQGGLLLGNSSVGGLNDGAWHHVVATKAAGDTLSAIKMYMDGNPVALTAQYAAGTITDLTNPNPLEIGARDMTAPGAENHGAFTGDMDEVAVYGSVLSAAAAKAHYDAGIVPEPSTLSLLAAGLFGLLVRRRR